MLTLGPEATLAICFLLAAAVLGRYVKKHSPPRTWFRDADMRKHDERTIQQYWHTAPEPFRGAERRRAELRLAATFGEAQRQRVASLTDTQGAA